MHEGILRKISKNRNELRTVEVRGGFLYHPEPGCRFNMTARALTGPGNRVVSTSPVELVQKIDDNKYMFKTMNSTYELEVL